METCWFIGSDIFPATAITVTANAVQEILNLPAGPRYLYDGGSSHDLLQAIRTLLESHSEITTVTATFLESGRIRISANVAFSVDSWSSNTRVRDALGFTGTLGSATSHTANLFSPLFWSPGKTESPDARLGTDGDPVPDVAVGQSGPGIVVATEHNAHLVNKFRFFHVDNDRVRTVNQSNGEYFRFWRTVLIRFRRFKMVRNVPENRSGTNPVNLGILPRLPSVGAYIQRYTQGAARFRSPRSQASGGFVESFNDVTIDVVGTVDF